MFVNLYIQSKNLKSIKKFLNFLDFYIYYVDSSLIVFKNFFKKVTNRKVITVLKSPHVNKISQEQFEFVIYRSQINIFSYKYFLLLLFIKYLKSTVLFSDIHLKVKLNFNSFKFNRKIISILNPNNFYLIDYNNLYISKNDLYLNLSYYLMLFDCYGNLILKNNMKRHSIV